MSDLDDTLRRIPEQVEQLAKVARAREQVLKAITEAREAAEQADFEGVITQSAYDDATRLKRATEALIAAVTDLLGANQRR